MSSDRRPAKVRVVAPGAGQSSSPPTSPPTAATPARRRTDAPPGEGEPAAELAAAAAPGGSLLWIAATIALFLVGCAVGGALFVMSGLTKGGPL